MNRQLNKIIDEYKQLVNRSERERINTLLDDNGADISQLSDVDLVAYKTVVTFDLNETILKAADHIGLATEHTDDKVTFLLLEDIVFYNGVIKEVTYELNKRLEK